MSAFNNNYGRDREQEMRNKGDREDEEQLQLLLQSITQFGTCMEEIATFRDQMVW